MPQMKDITADQLEEYLQLEEERKDLERKARALGKRSGALHDHFKAALETSGKKSAIRCGFRLTLVEGRASVAWKDAFIEKLGPLAADAMLESAPIKLKLDVQKA